MAMTQKRGAVPDERRKSRAELAVAEKSQLRAMHPTASLLYECLDETDRADVFLGFMIHDLARTRLRANGSFMKAYGLTRAQWCVLARLSRQDGMTQTMLADLLEVTKANLGMVIDGLEAAGWVERRESPSDMRIRRVFLTRSAVALMKRMFQSEVQFNNQTLNELTRKERDELFRLLAKAKAGVDVQQSVPDAQG